MRKHKEIVRFLGGGCVRARVGSVSGVYRVPCTSSGAARFFRISASQTLLLSLFSARAIRFRDPISLDFLQDLSCGDP